MNKSENYLNLLCASRNMVRGSEKGKENFVISPSKINSNDLSLYTFLGILMGVCIRTNTNLSINLPSLVWKQLVGQRLTIEDIEEFDDGIISEL
jgi:other hect domain ubiquitin protein ligase E3